MFEPKHLKLWAHPDCYIGAVWPATYVFLGQHRDSDALARSNFTVALDALGGESETVEVVRENHWAVGWVEWIGIHQDDEKALRLADEMADKLEDYPALDEEHFCALEYEEACDYWEQSSVKCRMDIIKHSGTDASIFSARRPDLPSDNGAIQSYLSQG